MLELNEATALLTQHVPDPGPGIMRIAVADALGAAGAASGPARRVRLNAPIACPWPLATFLPVCVSYNERGVAVAEPRPTNTSGDFAALAGTDGIVEIPQAVESVDAGTALTFYPWKSN